VRAAVRTIPLWFVIPAALLASAAVAATPARATVSHAGVRASTPAPRTGESRPGRPAPHPARRAGAHASRAHASRPSRRSPSKHRVGLVALVPARPGARRAPSSLPVPGPGSARRDARAIPAHSGRGPPPRPTTANPAISGPTPHRTGLAPASVRRRAPRVPAIARPRRARVPARHATPESCNARPPPPSRSIASRSSRRHVPPQAPRPAGRATGARRPGGRRGARPGTSHLARWSPR